MKAGGSSAVGGIGMIVSVKRNTRAARWKPLVEALKALSRGVSRRPNISISWKCLAAGKIMMMPAWRSGEYVCVNS